MGKIIKVRCNETERHVNAVDLDKVLPTIVIFKSIDTKAVRDIPERLVLPCQSCTAGKVIVTRQMLEENQ